MAKRVRSISAAQRLRRQAEAVRQRRPRSSTGSPRSAARRGWWRSGRRAAPAGRRRRDGPARPRRRRAACGRSRRASRPARCRRRCGVVLAGTSSTMAISMSVAVSVSLPSRTAIITLARIGMVLRRSTTLCTWASAFSRVARSTFSFMACILDGPRSTAAAIGQRGRRSRHAARPRQQRPLSAESSVATCSARKAARRGDGAAWTGQDSSIRRSSSTSSAKPASRLISSLDARDGVHDRGVVAVAELAADLGQASGW